MNFCFVFGQEPWLLPPALEMIDVITANGHNVDVIYAEYLGKPPAKGDYNTELTYDVVPKGNRFSRLRRSSLVRSCIKKLLKQKKIDVLIGCDIIAFQAVAGIRDHKIKKGYWCFEIPYPSRQLFSLHQFRVSRHKAWLKNIDFFMTPSVNRSKYLINTFGTKKPNTVIYNCKKQKSLPPVIDNYSNFKYKIAYTGRISSDQFIGEIVDAMSLVSEDTALFLAGIADEPFLETLKSRVSADPLLRDRIFFLGRLSREAAFDLVRISDIGFVLYTEDPICPTEPAPNKMGDYFAGNVWMVGTDQEYLHYWLEERGTGICVSEITKENLAKAINGILSQPKFSDKSILEKIYREEMNMNVQFDKMMALIQSI